MPSSAGSAHLSLSREGQPHARIGDGFVRARGPVPESVLGSAASRAQAGVLGGAGGAGGAAQSVP